MTSVPVAPARRFESDDLTAAEAITRAQHLAFAPFAFQAARVLRNRGILALTERKDGATAETIVAETQLSQYGVRVLLEAGLGVGLLTCRDGVYRLTKTGWFILHDRMTIVNMDFAHDVNYAGLAALDEAIATGKPAGLATLGDWPTIYQGLTKLPDDVQRSWFAFDHFYSDDAYALVQSTIARYGPASILDIGGNTGRFALHCLRHNPRIRVGIADLPGMAARAKASLEAQGFGDRVDFHPADLLDPTQDLPTGYGAVWMSQFLDCFSEKEIVVILRSVRRATVPGTPVFILEPLWDRQRREVAAFCLQMTSLYFTALANGNSQMYSAEVFLPLIAEAGFEVVEQVDHVGVCQSLLVCKAT